MVQVSIEADTWTGAPAPLAAPLQVSAQPVPHEVVELAKRPSADSPAESSWPSPADVDSPARISSGSGVWHCWRGLISRAALPVPAPSLCARVPGSSSATPVHTGRGRTGRCSPGSPGSARLPQIHHPGFLPVDLQSQPAFQFAFDPVPQSRTDVARQHHEVVRIADQLGLGPLRRSVRSVKHVVEPVQIDVGQQRTKHPALRRAPVVALHRRRLDLLAAVPPPALSATVESVPGPSRPPRASAHKRSACRAECCRSSRPGPRRTPPFCPPSGAAGWRAARRAPTARAETRRSSPRSPLRRSAPGSATPPPAPPGPAPSECPTAAVSRWPSGYTPAAPLGHDRSSPSGSVRSRPETPLRFPASRAICSMLTPSTPGAPSLRRTAPTPLAARPAGTPVRRDCRSETASVVWLSGPASVSVPGVSAAGSLPERKAPPPLVLS